jgi:RNA-directed DNA polymerase
MPKSDSTLDTEGWKTINWRQVERYVFNLQKRIYAASRCGDMQRVRRLQKTLMRSWSNRVLAVRRVTQDNQGKKTAGVDGIKSLSPAARFDLAKGLFINGKSKPTRRIWIPKPGKTESRGMSTSLCQRSKLERKSLLVQNRETV